LVQVLAFILNILPVPGLDGFGALEPYLPAQARRFANTVGLYAIVALVLLIIAVPAVGSALFGTGFAVFAALGGDPLAAAAGFREFLFWR
jgi:Zn-dependent protease